MANLKVVANLLSGLATFDNWSPDLAGILEWLLLDARGMTAPNPTPEDVEASRAIVDKFMPLEKATIGGEWYWATSSPCYTYGAEYSSNFRKRWAPGINSPSPKWGKRKAKWDGSAGAEKSYDLPNYIRVTDSVTWYARGDRAGVEELLRSCTGIGKKRSHGHGQISSWEVIEHESDWHLFGPKGELMRPIPVCEIPKNAPIDIAIRNWGWRPPSWLPANKTQCAMPVHTCREMGRNALGSTG